MNESQLIPAQEFAGKSVLLTGTTGFVGKVVLAMLLKHCPSVGRVYALIRPGIQAKSKERFQNSVLPSPALNPLREIYGEGLEEFLAQKVIPIDGNVVKANCAIPESDLDLLERDGLDIIINSAGLVDFDPAVDQALGINVVGAQNVVDLAKRFNAGLVHISTCYVNGGREGPVLEDDEVLGYFPKRAEMGSEVFDHKIEITRLTELAAEVRSRVKDSVQQSLFRTRAIELLAEEGRDWEDPKVLKSAILRQRKRWVTLELKRIGMERAQFWGWQNTYTYTKSLGEQIIAEARNEGLNACIIRPSIVESSLAFPFPGWNEGFTTTAPLILLARQGLRDFPYAEDLILDIIPVDMVAATIVLATAAALAGEHKFIYQAASGALNPLTIKKAIEFTGFGVRDYSNRTEQKGLKGFMLRNHEMQPITEKKYFRFGVPKYREMASSVLKAMDKVGPDKFGWARQSAEAITKFANEVEEQSMKVETVMELFLPFVAGASFVFRSDNSLHLVQRLSEEDREKFAFDPSAFLWRDYFRKIHVPGLEKWVLPKLEAELQEKPKHAYVFRSLLELFNEATHKYRHKVVFNYNTSEGIEHLTFGEVRTLSERVAGFLKDQGTEASDRVLIVCENRPEWPATYFGIQWAGLTAVPIDSASTAQEIANIAQASEARGIILSPKVLERFQQAKRLSGSNKLFSQEDGNDIPIWPMSSVINHQNRLTKAQDPARIASIIFTSGTTGKPKGVMLSQRNFTFEVSRLGGVFDLGKSDHLLSVLPLHHTFEFTAGLLVPFSRGTRITYLEELTPDTLSTALESGVTGLIGVPALWELLERRIDSKLNDAGPLPSLVMEGVKNVNLFLREHFNFNAGSIAAYPVHRALGGRLKHLVSGGSALNPEVTDFFRGLGFNLTQGYGLTETAPVLTVSDPANAHVQGSVGKPLPGIEVRIDSPNEQGIGEVFARGPNIMQGYFGNEEATKEVLVDGWLKTGDLGHQDDEGNLFLVGRAKDVIVDRDGRNVYPDELEDVYSNHDAIAEMSVVGLVQSDGNEKVACLIVPDDEYSIELSLDKTDPHYATERREQIRSIIRDHLKRVNEGLGYYKRVKIVHFWDHDLPRTATRKIKRPEVLRIIERLEKSKTVAQAVVTPGTEGTPLTLARKVIASLVGKELNHIQPDSRLAGDLSFDSLLFVELASALESHLRTDISNEAILAAETVADIASLLTLGGRSEGAPLINSQAKESIIGYQPEHSSEENASYNIPSPVASLGKRLLGWGQTKFYELAMETDVKGRHCIPKSESFLVAANHNSHLDAGLVKTSLGEYGRNLVTLAARDYFFGPKLRRTYFENFTNIIAIERNGSVKQSLRRALATLASGKNLLLFPEGTRSDTGEMDDFKTTVGYLAVQSRKPVLPMYLWGTHEAMPKGATIIPSARQIGCVIGPALWWEHFQRLEEGRARNEAYRLCTFLVQNAVSKLREHGTYDPNALIEDLLAEFTPKPEVPAVQEPLPQPVILAGPILAGPILAGPVKKKVRRRIRKIKNQRPEL